MPSQNNGIYIFGPMAGIDNLNKEEFDRAEAEVAMGICLSKTFCKAHYGHIVHFTPTITGKS